MDEVLKNGEKQPQREPCALSLLNETAKLTGVLFSQPGGKKPRKL